MNFVFIREYGITQKGAMTFMQRIKQGKRPVQTNGIIEGVIWKQLLLFFFPILLGTFFQQLYNTVDAIVVGNYVGKEALAAVGGTTGTLINLIVGFFVGLSSGATVIISQYYGAKDNGNVSRTVHTALAMATAMGLFLTVFGLIFSPALLRLMDTPEDVMEPAVTYIRIYFLGMVPSLIYNVGSGILRAIGDSKRPLYFLIIACLTNIVLDILLVVGFHIGVAGAAWATILSQAVSAALVIIVLLHSSEAYRLDLRQLRFHGDLLQKIVRIGLPAGLQSVMYSLSNAVIQTCINGFGTDMMAAFTVWGKLDSIMWMVVQAFGVSITTFVGQNFGAGKLDRVHKSVRVCLAMAAVSVLLISALLLLCGEPMMRLFTQEEKVLELGMEICRFMAPVLVSYVCIEIFSGAVRGAGDALIPTLMTLGGVCLLRIVWLKTVAPMYSTINAVLICYPISWVLTSILFVIYYHKGGWLKRCLARSGSMLSDAKS